MKVLKGMGSRATGKALACKDCLALAIMHARNSDLAKLLKLSGQAS